MAHVPPLAAGVGLVPRRCRCTSRWRRRCGRRRPSCRPRPSPSMYFHSRAKPPRPMLCLITSVRVLALDVLHLAEDDQVLFLVHLLDLHEHDVGRLRDDLPQAHAAPRRRRCGRRRHGKSAGSDETPAASSERREMLHDVSHPCHAACEPTRSRAARCMRPRAIGCGRRMNSYASPQVRQPLLRGLGPRRAGVIAHGRAAAAADRLVGLLQLAVGPGRLEQGRGAQLGVVVGERHHEQRVGRLERTASAPAGTGRSELRLGGRARSRCALTTCV